MTTLVKTWLLITRRLTTISSPKTKLSINKRYVYVANHASYLDPIVLWSVLTFRQRLNGAPTKVMTASYVYFSFLRPLIWLLGAYPAKKREGQRVHAGIEGSLYYLHHGYNICIFPEGKRSLESEQRAFNGVSRILAEVDEYEMILIRIIWQPGPWWKRTLELRAEIAPDDLNHHDPQAIMKYIYTM
ncbi:MAG: lysophospholipid acyltransferase family protein [Candidatus Saccharimonadales bacterium]